MVLTGRERIKMWVRSEDCRRIQILARLEWGTSLEQVLLKNTLE
jgi:hypothetical protein